MSMNQARAQALQSSSAPAPAGPADLVIDDLDGWSLPERSAVSALGGFTTICLSEAAEPPPSAVSFHRMSTAQDPTAAAPLIGFRRHLRPEVVRGRPRT